MELYINLPLNSIKITNTETTPDHVFMMELAEALAKLDRDREIEIIFDMSYTPLAVVLYLKKVKENSQISMKLFNTEDTKVLREGLKGFGFTYLNIDEVGHAWH